MTALAIRAGSRLASIAEALLTPHGTDRYLELVDPMLARGEIRGVVTAVRRQTSDTVTLTVRPNKAWGGFVAGQYVRVSVDIDGVRRTRCYSPACSQARDDGRIELTLKADPNGLVSRYLHTHAQRGMVLGLSQPDGEFTMPAPRPRRMLLISGGSGITPLLAMLRTLADEGYTGDVAFVHYANTEHDALYRDELLALRENHANLRVLFAYTHAHAGGQLHGLFTREHLRTAAPWYREAETYVCGPTPLMDAVRATFEEDDISAQLHTEEFSPPALQINDADATGQVRFTYSGRQIANSGKPLLEQAEDAGLRPEHGCRMGICFSCTQVKTTGCVRNALSGELCNDDDVEIQLCINVPVTDTEINC